MSDKIRFDQLAARNLGLTRKDAQNLVRRRRLTVVGRPEIAVNDRIVAQDCPLAVMLDGKARDFHDRVFFLQHKPTGVVTSRDDPIHPTAYALLRDQPLFAELVAIGRLDLDATGLLLWTNHGPSVHAWTHPKRQVQRTYHVALARPHAPVDETVLLRDGFTARVLGLEPLTADTVHPALIRSEEDQCYVAITLASGAYHEVKRIFAALDSHVNSLARVAHGGIRLPSDLPAGGCIQLPYQQLSLTAQPDE